MITDPKNAKASEFYADFGFRPLRGDRMFLPMRKALEWLKVSAP
ncbi:MAG: hypothetical protein NTW21_08520 [Verrucomicrobia bacterium]|nr:hypothetical protein [Verrucomicrobiota bacterium]